MVDSNDGNKKPVNPEHKHHPVRPDGVKKVVKKKKKVSPEGQQNKERPKTHRNAILFLVAILLFIYAGFIALYPTILRASFDKAEFGRKVEDTTGLITSIKNIEFKLSPVTLTIIVNEWVSDHMQDQPCFKADRIEIHANPLCMITKNFVIKDMDLQNVRYYDQMLDNGENKLDRLSEMNFSQFNVDKVSVTPGPVSVKNFTITSIDPDTHRDNERSFVKYSRSDVKAFLESKNFKNVIIK